MSSHVHTGVNGERRRYNNTSAIRGAACHQSSAAVERGDAAGNDGGGTTDYCHWHGSGWFQSGAHCVTRATEASSGSCVLFNVTRGNHLRRGVLDGVGTSIFWKTRSAPLILLSLVSGYGAALGKVQQIQVPLMSGRTR